MGAFKLGKMTFGSLFKKPETVLYPLEKKPQPAGLKGHIVVDVNACILCGMCERNCTTGCITVDKGERYWAINPYRCIQCGYCITVCPKKCLHMDPNYWAAAPEKSAQRFSVPAQEKVKSAVGTQPIPTAKGGGEAEKGQAGSAARGGETALCESAAPVAKEAHVPRVAMPETANPALAPESGIEDRDVQLEKLISLLDEEKAKIVESALGGR